MSKKYETQYITVISNVDEVLRASEAQIEQALEVLGIAAESHAVDEVTRLVYDTPESPNYKRTRRLRDSITHQTNNVGKYVDVGSAVYYAPYVELGTRKMKPRPFLRNAVENYKSEYESLVKSTLKQ